MQMVNLYLDPNGTRIFVSTQQQQQHQQQESAQQMKQGKMLSKGSNASADNNTENLTTQLKETPDSQPTEVKKHCISSNIQVVHVFLLLIQVSSKASSSLEEVIETGLP